MRGTRNLLWLVPAAFFLAAPLWWPRAAAFLRPRGDFGQNGPAAEERPRTFTMQKVALSQTRDGVVDLEIVASQVSTPQGESYLEMEGVQAVIFDRTRQPTQIRGGQATYDSDAQILKFQDHVTINSHTGYQMTADSLSYEAAARRVETSDQVHITGDSITIHGHGLRFDLDSNDFKVGGRVRVTVQ